MIVCIAWLLAWSLSIFVTTEMIVLEYFCVYRASLNYHFDINF
jgi:hypothetical protein